MTQTPTETVAQRVKELRKRRNWSARQLADRCAELGAAGLDRSVLANLESGRRRTVSIDEVFVLAAALDVAPVHLCVPVEDEVDVLVTPTWRQFSRSVREWVRGQQPLRFQDARLYVQQVPLDERPSASEMIGRTISAPLAQVIADNFLNALRQNPEFAARLAGLEGGPVSDVDDEGDED